MTDFKRQHEASRQWSWLIQIIHTPLKKSANASERKRIPLSANGELLSHTCCDYNNTRTWTRGAMSTAHMNSVWCMGQGREWASETARCYPLTAKFPISCSTHRTGCTSSPWPLSEVLLITGNKTHRPLSLDELRIGRAHAIVSAVTQSTSLP